VFSTFAYRHSPVRLQESLIGARAALRARLREGRRFEALAAQVDDSQWWSSEELRAYQERSVDNLLEFAAREVPYYRGRGADLAQWPLLDKAAVRAAGRDLLAGSRRGPLVAGSTSGTTGTPLRLWQDLIAINRENAFIWRQLEWAGLKRGERRAWMRSDMVVPVEQREPPYWRLNRAENMLMLSSYHLADSRAAAYLEALADFDPVLIQAYPSSIGFLAAWMLASGTRYRGPALRGIVTSSETLPAVRRRDIAVAFGCPVYDWYGLNERVAAIGTCEHGRYHLMSDYSHVEFLPAGDGLFELVGTGFNNMAMPLIRYRTGDFVRLPPGEQHCVCGRAFPLIEGIDGRVDEAVKLADGRVVGRLTHVFEGLDGILEAQIVQDQVDALAVLIVPCTGYGLKTEKLLLDKLRFRLGMRVSIEIRRVDAIARGPNGKFKGVVSSV
jgi:phenylacetate-coenzyme A ligase PaaK-like adenylate-forming protein